MLKENMILKNQVHHIRAERDILTESENPWIVTLYSSFQDTSNLYMVMEFLPGGDLMGMLQKKEIFPEEKTKQYVAEIALAIASVHALGYIHRDLKPDNMYVFNQRFVCLWWCSNQMKLLQLVRLGRSHQID